MVGSSWIRLVRLCPIVCIGALTVSRPTASKGLRWNATAVDCRLQDAHYRRRGSGIDVVRSTGR